MQMLLKTVRNTFYCSCYCLAIMLTCLVLLSVFFFFFNSLMECECSSVQKVLQHKRVKNSHYNRNIGEGNGTPPQYSCPENPMDGGAWQAEVHGVTKSRTQLSNFTFIFHFYPLEKEMATHSSVLAWRIPGTGEPRGLPSMGCTDSDTTEATQQQQEYNTHTHTHTNVT